MTHIPALPNDELISIFAKEYYKLQARLSETSSLTCVNQMHWTSRRKTCICSAVSQGHSRQEVTQITAYAICGLLVNYLIS